MLTVYSSWNKDLAKQRGIHMGAEFQRKGVNMMLGPVVGPLGHIAEGGRNWEGFSDDPYLSGALVQRTIQGVQSSGVGTCVKVSKPPRFHQGRLSSSQLNGIALHRERTRDEPKSWKQ
jgi:beta-glucosidase